MPGDRGALRDGRRGADGERRRGTDEDPARRVKSGIYAITHLPSGRCYIGSSGTLGDRLAEHRRKLRRGIHENARLQHAWNKYGAESFAFEVIERVAEAAALFEREQVWLDRRKPWFNIHTRAGSARGYRHTTAAKVKISAAAALPRSEETKRAISECARRRPIEHLLKIGDANARVIYLFNSPAGQLVEVRNLTRFCRTHGLNQPNMHKVWIGARRHHRGWTSRKDTDSASSSRAARYNESIEDDNEAGLRRVLRAA